ncbi:MAG: hypothetical protein LBS76_02960 [Mycoplasmataceae bacterium]|nr:hypothetical protein [Mycoplasmataceae bacterium]
MITQLVTPMDTQINWKAIIEMFKIKTNPNLNFKYFNTNDHVFYFKEINENEFEVGHYESKLGLNDSKVAGVARFKF